MNFLESIILGVLQGITEFLPVSSSGQLVIAEHFFSLDNIDPRVLKTFDIFLHSGTLFALFILFWRDFWDIISFLYKKFVQLFGINKKISKEEQEGEKLLYLLIIGTIPAVVIALLFEDLTESVRTPLYVAFFLALTALLFLLAENLPKKTNNKKISLKNAFIIGAFQAIAILPGISRSGATISGGLFQGLRRDVGAKFSFMLATPIILGASLLSLKRILNEGFSEELPALITLSGFLSSFVFSFITAKFLLSIFRKVSLSYFSIFLFIESALLIYFN